MIYKLLKYSLALTLATVVFQLSAQNEFAHLFGQLKDEGTRKKLDGCQVQVFKDGSQFDVYDAGTTGKYEFKLPLGFTYDIKFSKPDYLSKIIRIDTRNIPEEERYGGFDMNIDGTLFPYREGFNTDILKDPLAIAKYDDVGDELAFDFDYSEGKAKMIQAEFKRLDDIAKNFEKLKKEFDDLVKEGDQAMIEKKYDGAIKNYKAALAIFPKDEPVKGKLADAQAKFDALNADKELEAKYQKAVKDGDDLFKGKKYPEAKKKFEEAKKLKEKETYPKEMLYQIDLAMQDMEKRNEYDALVADADKKFNNKDYAVSIDTYRQASAMYPVESYPKDQIVKAEAALKNLLAGEAEKLRIQKEYDDKIALAARNFSEDKLEQAISNYKEASFVKPEETLPKEKIAEIEALIAERKAKGDADAAMANANAEKERIEKEFNALILAADELFAKEAWLDSRSKYVAALKVKAEAQYPKSRIERIDMELSKKDDDLERLRQKAIADSLAALRLASMTTGLSRKDELQKQAKEDFERRKLAQEEQRIAEAEKLNKKKRERNFTIEVDEAAEDEVEQYYREAKAKEDAARYNEIKQKLDENNSFYTRNEKKSTDLIAQREDDIVVKKESIKEMQAEGDSWHGRAVADTERKKGEANKDQSAYKQRSDNRLLESESEIQKKKDASASLSQNDRNRAAKVSEMTDNKDRFAKNNEGYEKRGDALRTDNKLTTEREKTEQSQLAFDGEEVRKENEQHVASRLEEEQKRDADEAKAAKERISNATMLVDEKKATQESLDDGKETIISDRATAIDGQKQEMELDKMEKELKSANDRFDSRNAAFELKAGEPKSEDEYLAVPGTDGLKEGVVENSYKDGNKMITERTLKVGNKVDTYKKVVSKTAIYYFKNDRSITEVMWRQETTTEPE